MIGDRKEVILRIIRDRLGPERAITAREIGAMVGLDDRTVRQIIRHLIVAEGQGEILASTGSDAFPGCPPGYFWAATRAQCETYYDVLVSRREDITQRMTAAWHARNRLTRAPKGQIGLGV